VSGPHFEFSADNSAWFVISSGSPKLIANRTYTFKLTNASSHPFRVFDTDGFNRLVKTTVGGASGTAADGFWGGDVTMTVVLLDKTPFSYDCGLHGFEGGIGENALVYGGDCSICAQPAMYLRLNEDPATYPPPPAWPSSVPVLQYNKSSVYTDVFSGSYADGLKSSFVPIQTYYSSVIDDNRMGLTGQISGIKLKLYGLRSTIASADNKCVVFLGYTTAESTPITKRCLLAGELDASGTNVSGGIDYVIEPNDSLSAWSFGAAGTYKPNPNSKLSTSYEAGDSLPHAQLIDLIGLSARGTFFLLIKASNQSGAGVVTVDSFSVEILTSNDETRTFWARPNDQIGFNPTDAFGVLD
jgi:hypothetical protein